MKTDNKYTFTEAKKKLESYCAYQERCRKEVLQKLSEMGLVSEEKEKIITHLTENDFLNESRFAKTFARGKFRIKNWGTQRITNELKQRGISDKDIRLAMNELNTDDYKTKLDQIARLRLSQIKETNRDKKRRKLSDYLLYRGWETNLVYEKVFELVS